MQPVLRQKTLDPRRAGTLCGVSLECRRRGEAPGDQVAGMGCDGGRVGKGDCDPARLLSALKDYRRPRRCCCWPQPPWPRRRGRPLPSTPALILESAFGWCDCVRREARDPKLRPDRERPGRPDATGLAIGDRGATRLQRRRRRGRRHCRATRIDVFARHRGDVRASRDDDVETTVTITGAG